MKLLLDTITSLYDIGPITASDRVATGFLSENHVVSSGAGRFFLKKYRFAEAAKIRRIHASKSFFSQGGIPIIMPLTTKDGATFFTHESAHFALFPYIAGQHSDRKRLTPRASASLGRMLGLIHLCGADCALDADPADKPGNRTPNLEQIELLLSKARCAPVPGDFDRTAIEILEIKRSFAESAPHTTYSAPANDHLLHGDYHDANVFFDGRNEVAHVFDLEKTGYGPRTDEIFRAMTYSLICGDSVADVLAKAEAFMDAYRGIYPISDEEIIDGLQIFIHKHMRDNWVETEHYLRGNTRVDVLARFELTRLQFLTAHLPDLIARLTRRQNRAIISRTIPGIRRA